jgi:hypothetical protein
MKKNYIIGIIIVFAFNQCKNWIEEFTPIDIYNNSEFIISTYMPLIGIAGAVYPDTTLSILKENIGYPTISGKTAHRTISNISYEKWIASFPNDTVSIYIFNQDTLNRYSWEEIQRDYKILQRYDLSLEDIRKLKNQYGVPEIPYPPTEIMKNMKMYPPYGTYNK